jgi:heme/copper-type cytochrome/quinol oxidase subunit 4
MILIFVIAIILFLIYLTVDTYMHNEWTKKAINKINGIFDEALTIITITRPAWIKSLFNDEE